MLADRCRFLSVARIRDCWGKIDFENSEATKEFFSSSWNACFKEFSGRCSSSFK